MLEHQSLLVRPWTWPAKPPPGRQAREAGPGAVRAILDQDTGWQLGLARWQLPARSPWLAWLSRPLLTVHEIDDEPLVFTVRRLWALTPRWEVCDADGHSIAVVRRGWVLDRFGGCLAWIEPVPEADGFRFHGRDGRELAELNRSGNDLRVRFADDLFGEPFVKMALLAAVLCGAH
jgi:hypothetical protein